MLESAFQEYRATEQGDLTNKDQVKKFRWQNVAGILALLSKGSRESRGGDG